MTRRHGTRGRGENPAARESTLSTMAKRYFEKSFHSSDKPVARYEIAFHTQDLEARKHLGDIIRSVNNKYVFPPFPTNEEMIEVRLNSCLVNHLIIIYANL